MDNTEDRLREAVRAALNEYRTSLRVLRSTDPANAEHYTVSITQVESAKRVLWMED